jgi:hypothetical protein
MQKTEHENSNSGSLQLQVTQQAHQNQLIIVPTVLMSTVQCGADGKTDRYTSFRSQTTHRYFATMRSEVLTTMVMIV